MASLSGHIIKRSPHRTIKITALLRRIIHYASMFLSSPIPMFPEHTFSDRAYLCSPVPMKGTVWECLCFFCLYYGHTIPVSSSQHGCRVMSRVLVVCHSSFQNCPYLPTHSTISGCHFAFPPHVSIRTSAPFGNILSSRQDVATTLRQLRCDELVIIPFHVGMLVQFTTSVRTTENNNVLLCNYGRCRTQSSASPNNFNCSE